MLAIAALALLGACPAPARARYVARDAWLRAQPLYFYPAVGTPARAVVFLFGNDVGFWKAHQELAERLRARGYDVIGFDVRRYIETLPEPRASRESAFVAGMHAIVPRAVHELGADSLPLVLGGHSFGASLAIWLAARAAPQRTVGVLALSPTARAHMRVTPLDLANVTDPHGPGSFSVADDVAAMPRGMRLALVRGASDWRRSSDSALRAGARGAVRYTVIPLAGHSLKSLTIAGPMIGWAVDWLTASR